MSSFNVDLDIRKLLPHRNAMLMVDKQLELNAEIIKTAFLIKPTTIFVENNQFSEVGLIENIVQTCSIIVGSSYFDKAKDGDENKADIIGFISAIKTINIHTLPFVGDLLSSQGKLISRYDGAGFSICTMAGIIHSNDVLLLDCELNLFIKRVKDENE